MDTGIIEFSPVSSESIDLFISRWSQAKGTEKANYQLFLTELCTLLGLPQPDPASDENADNGYVFERRVDINNPDGTTNRGFIDLYRRGSFILEAKQSGKELDSLGWDKAMLKAQNQADQYLRALPGGEGRPPFIVVTDVGRTLELYSEFSCTGGTYVPYPDPGHHRIRLKDLHDHAIQERLFKLWHNPSALDPSKHAARVTRLVSTKLADLARSLEKDGYEVDRVAHFLKRALFTMFSEDVGLLPLGSFTTLLTRLKATPEHFVDSMNSLWTTMHTGGYEGQLMHKIRQFNGGLFQGIEPIPLKPDQIQLLIDAGKADWRYVEPAIFGTLLERALDPRERHKLGAHFTPRAYVERLVMPTLIDPLREQWRVAQVVAETWLQQGKPDKALNALRQFHKQLCETRVLDPACGSANFLYVALEHMKRLEGEVVNLIRDLHGGQSGFEWQSDEVSRSQTVDPHQFLGLELNPRAAAIAEIVLWIGYLQWHYRIHGKLDIPDPVLKDFRNIEHRDALIDYDSKDIVYDANGQPVTIWDGISYKPSLTTGELIPDAAGRLLVYHYNNPRKAQWPKADYIVGNPPFIGASTMRRALGDGYVDAVRQVFKGEVPDSADFVMYWWHTAAHKVREGEALSFGFITTNSLRQTFNRKVLEPLLNDTKKPLSLTFAIPDHPWVDSNDGAAVRIAMTVGVSGERTGVLRQVIAEQDGSEEAREVSLNLRDGKVFADLTIGANVAGAQQLSSNIGVAIKGFELGSQGFLIDKIEADKLLGKLSIAKFLKPYMNGRDLTIGVVERYVIDFYGMDENTAMSTAPELFQWLIEKVKPERQVNRESRTSKNWWLYRRSGAELRRAISGLTSYIATTRTARHRVFQFLPSNLVAESKIVVIASKEPAILGVLSSRIHNLFAMSAGGWLGVGNDATYNHIDCFNKFPFPSLNDPQIENISKLAEKLDAHRKRQQAEYTELTLTGMYNVLEKLRVGEGLTPKEKLIYQQGLVSILRELHDDLDRVVFDAYGWSDLAEKLVGKPGATTPLPDKPAEQAEAEEELLLRLVALNAKRAAEEANGLVRWLRPEYQASESTQISADLIATEVEGQEVDVPVVSKQSWPGSIPEQVGVVRSILQKGPRSVEGVAAHFVRKPIKAVTQILSALEVLGHARHDGEIWSIH